MTPKGHAARAAPVATPSPSGAGRNGGDAMTSPGSLPASVPIAIRSRGSRQQLTMEDVMEAEEDEERQRRLDKRRVAATEAACAVTGAASGGGGVPLQHGAGEVSMTFEEAFETASVASRSSSVSGIGAKQRGTGWMGV